MPFYKSEGKVPKKRHTTMYNGEKTLLRGINKQEWI